MKNVMLDLETLSTRADAAIVAIGAVEFDSSGLGREFYRVIDLKSCVDAGLVMDPGTVVWWMNQSPQARAIFNQPTVSIANALVEFAKWLPEGAYIWGNGATFDNVILSHAYTMFDMKRPWSYRNDRCFRTLKAMAPHIDYPQFSGTEHNALDDAKFQAEHARLIINDSP